MHTGVPAPGFPRRETLVRYFRAEAQPVPIADAAELLGATLPQLRELLGEETQHATIPWGEVAHFLFSLWPRAQLLETLGAAEWARIPRDFRPVRVHWSIPAFTVHAMQHQAEKAWLSDERVRAGTFKGDVYARGVSDYIADILYNEIEPDTVRAFRHDRAFMEAFRYPDVD